MAFDKQTLEAMFGNSRVALHVAYGRNDTGDDAESQDLNQDRVWTPAR